jgi:glucosamine--fructose-6-phosphate aminotransferase (isomerizing)
MSNVKEVRARGADVFGITTEKHAEEIKKTVPSVILVPETHPLLQPSLTIIPLQTFAYYVALLRGCDIDKPKNLAKSVTVE